MRGLEASGRASEANLANFRQNPKSDIWFACAHHREAGLTNQEYIYRAGNGLGINIVVLSVFPQSGKATCNQRRILYNDFILTFRFWGYETFFSINFPFSSVVTLK